MSYKFKSLLDGARMASRKLWSQAGACSRDCVSTEGLGVVGEELLLTITASGCCGTPI
jgi:hypothetical protein